jgi:hypothetical protein
MSFSLTAKCKRLQSVTLAGIHFREITNTITSKNLHIEKLYMPKPLFDKALRSFQKVLPANLNRYLCSHHSDFNHSKYSKTLIK